MATKKFAGPSPYVINTTYPEVDFRHTEYINNATAKKSRTSAAPVVAAIFGLGRAGSIHLSSIIRNPRIILKYIVDDRPEIFTELKSYWKLEDQVVCLTSKNADRVYKDKSVNTVFIASPTYTHHDIVVNAIANNKDVFCEKPIAETIEETRKCYEASKAKGRVLFSAFNRRFDPAYRSLKERARQGEVGHIQILKVTSRDSPLPTINYLSTSGGVFHDCVVHDFDIACWILGELPVRVHATASGLITEVKAIDDFDNIAFLLTYPSGTVAIGDNSRFCAYGYDQRLEVFGNKGMIKVENEKPAHSLESYIGQDGIKLNPIYYSFPSRYKIAYRRELEHFLDVVQYGVPIEVSSWQTLAISKIATAAEESARTGKTVELDWSKDGIPAEYS
ncbi:inositol 2-dehydrogenase-like [Pararge aegeria]|uniref:inositol 2-dehydrogenase-like n=1 Tax=Pararge aegeria TaxID=116150 RepID=UPI0019D2D2BB|nr:inositol 2-dehydrogenase-like [Pararge aegeria]XP_039746331.1 inositol 2-dehydrogenase-like [Pararge aegeria]